MSRTKINCHYVNVLADLLSDGNGKSQQAARFLKIVITDRMWRCRFVRELGKNVKFDCLETFVRAPPPEGLGITVEKLKIRCGYDERMIKLINRELSRSGTRRIRCESNQR